MASIARMTVLAGRASLRAPVVHELPRHASRQVPRCALSTQVPTPVSIKHTDDEAMMSSTLSATVRYPKDVVAPYQVCWVQRKWRRERARRNPTPLCVCSPPF